MLKSVSAFAPATVANVGSAFDVLGFAIEEPGDLVTITRVETQGITISKIDGDDGKLPFEPEKNTVGVSILAYLKEIAPSLSIDLNSFGLEIELKKGLPIGSGLGSSSASTVAGVFAVNHLLGAPLPKQDLLRFAMQGEAAACGAAHADNVAPSLLGGFVLIRSYDPLDIVTIAPPIDLHAVVVSPQIEVRTADARKILKREIQLSDAIKQWGNVGGLMVGLCRSDYELIGRSLTDVVIEPIRAALIPGFTMVKQNALEAGALGCSISGSGPTIFALSRSLKDAQKIGAAMKIAFSDIKIESTVRTSKINSKGAEIVMES